MSSGHRVVAIIAVWSALTIALTLLFSTIFINHMPMSTVVDLTWILAGAGAFATLGIALARRP
jgi:hypothetical protein